MRWLQERDMFTLPLCMPEVKYLPQHTAGSWGLARECPLLTVRFLTCLVKVVLDWVSVGHLTHYLQDAIGKLCYKHVLCLMFLKLNIYTSPT